MSSNNNNEATSENVQPSNISYNQLVKDGGYDNMWDFMRCYGLKPHDHEDVEEAKLIIDAFREDFEEERQEKEQASNQKAYYDSPSSDTYGMDEGDYYAGRYGYDSNDSHGSNTPNDSPDSYTTYNSHDSYDSHNSHDSYEPYAAYDASPDTDGGYYENDSYDGDEGGWGEGY